jgi:SulP family sulfate permease
VQVKSRIFASPLDESSGGFAAMPHAWHLDPRGNVAGGLLAAIVSLPLAMGLGALAFSPFGPEYAGRGVLAGLYAAAFLGLVALLMGSRGVAIYAPRSLVAFMIASVAADVLVDAKWLQGADPDMVSAALFLMLALAGAFQLAFGLGGMSRVMKYIPTPVMAGFQNSAAITIMASQVHVLLGLSARPAWEAWPAALGETRPLSVLVALATLFVVARAPRIAPRVPPLVLGLAAGTLLYYFFDAVGLESLLGPTIGPISMSMPDGRELAAIMALPMAPGFWEALPLIALGAASLALVASLDVMMNAKVVETVSRRRGNSTQELVSMGTANLVTPLLGGIAGSINLSATTTAMRGGARNSLALLVHCVLFLVFVPLLAAAIAYVPRVVIGVLLVHAGILLIDRWTLELLRRISARKWIHWPSILVDLCVIILVAAVAIAGEIVAAVLLGVAVAVVIFTMRMSRGIIRREQSGEVIQSRRARDAADAALLREHGRQILAIELEGPMFFASAEALHNRLHAVASEGVRYLILDVARVTELDSTGARILLQADVELRGANCRLLLCGMDAELEALLRDHGVAEVLTRERIFPDLDRALEWGENATLAELRSAAPDSAEQAFELLDIVRDVDPADRDALRAALQRREYRKGENVFCQGDDGDALYIIAQGSASAWLGDPEAEERRLMTFSQGTFFGEMALLDRERRSATISADNSLVCYVLERSAFERLCASHPRAGLAILSNLGRELSLRMRRANRTLLELG